MTESDTDSLIADEQDSRSCDSCPLVDKTREEMIMKIKEYDFSIIELGLYLDTHPYDKKAIYLHREYCKNSKELKDKYQRIYGPLTIN